MKPAQTNERITVLVVDDDAVDRELVRRLLPANSAALEAVGGDEGLKKAQERAPDCVLLDFFLPDCDGTDLLDRFRPLGCGLVVLTGHGNESLVAEVMKHGAHDYLPKGNLSRPALERAIRNAVQTAQLQAQVRDKQEEFRCFAHTAAHDLRAPLRKIKQWTSILAETQSSRFDEEGRRACSRVQGSVTDMEALIQGLLDYARMEESAIEARPVDLGLVVKQALSNLQRLIDERGAVVSVGPLPLVHGHQTALVLLFQNLIGNAVKFNRSTPHVDVGIAEKLGKNVIAVRDDGIGIETADVERIFRPFTRAVGREAFEGSGLGLATCTRIVANHGGSISVESEPGRGSTFFLYFPALDSSVGSDAADPSRTVSASKP